jgi:glutamate 5-kinase
VIEARARLKRARRVVIKIGSRLLSEDPVGRPAALAVEVAALRARGVSAVVVSSGAIALGRQALGLAERPRELPRLQAAAAVGQGRLMQAWERAFAPHGLPVAQILLTHDDVGARGRFLAARHAIAALVGDFGAVPIINENDTVATEEIKFGDNDGLAALVVNLVAAEALIILTDVNGLHDADPRAGGVRIPVVVDIDREAGAAGGSSSGIGTGGMASKVQAAKIAGRTGVPTVVAEGRRPDVVRAVLAGEDLGTLFTPSEERLASRKHWIAFALRPAGAVVVDAGARAAVCDKQKSLLPSGIRAVNGRFEAGEPVSVLDEDGRELARGLASYSADEIERIRGKRSADIEAILGYKNLDEVIHRDDLVVL